MDITRFRNVAMAFSMFYNSTSTNIVKIVEEAREYKNSDIFSEENINSYIDEFADLKTAIAYIFLVEDSLKEKDILFYSLSSLPLNYDKVTDSIHEEFAVYATYERSFKKQVADVPVSQYFNRFIFIKKEFYSYVEHIYISNTSKFLNENNEFKITFIPIGFNFKVNNIEKDNKTFIQGENVPDIAYKKSFMKVCENNSAIIFSCEICGCKELDDYIYDNYDIKHALCIAAPSYHRFIDGGNYNKSLIYYYDYFVKLKLAEVNKAESFYKYDKDTNKNILNEVLCSRKPHYVVFHLKNIGVVLFVICKDALSNFFKKIIETLNPNITIIIAYTEKYDDFNSVTTQLTSTGNIVIVGNSCVAYKASGEKHCPLIAFHNDKNKKYSKVGYVDCECKNIKYCLNKEICYFEIDIRIGGEKGYKISKIVRRGE